MLYRARPVRIHERADLASVKVHKGSAFPTLAQMDEHLRVGLIRIAGRRDDHRAPALASRRVLGGDRSGLGVAYHWQGSEARIQVAGQRQASVGRRSLIAPGCRRP